MSWLDFFTGGSSPKLPAPTHENISLPAEIPVVTPPPVLATVPGATSAPSERCIRLIEKSEGCALTAYVDVDGSYVLGYGCKIFDGKPVVAGQTTDAAGADRNCRQHAQKCASGVMACVKVQITQGQLDAMVDFVYNIGLGALQKSTLLRILNVHAPVTEAMFTAWNKITQDGKLVELPALTTRRKAEYQLFIS